MIYTIVGVLVFLFLMFLGHTGRIANLEILMANQIQFQGTQIEFNKKVQTYHDELEQWLKKLDKDNEVMREIIDKREQAYVKAATERK